MMPKSACARILARSLDDEDIKKIAVGAIKYSDFVADRKTGILYDPDKIFALTGQSGPFCQYADVRMRRILELIRKADYVLARALDLLGIEIPAQM